MFEHIYVFGLVNHLYSSIQERKISIFTKKAWIFGLKMTIFQILIKWPEMIVSGCYMAQNDRNQQSQPEIDVRSQYYMRNISNLPKKSSGVQK